LDEGLMAEARFRDAQVKILKLTSKGREAVILYESRVTLELRDANGQPHEVLNILTSRDTWVKTSQGWRTKAGVVLKAKTLVDGNPVEP
jgi:hypothetical protein